MIRQADNEIRSNNEIKKSSGGRGRHKGRKMNRLPGHVRKSSGTMKDTLNWTKLNAILTSSFFIFSLFFTISTMNVVARCYRHFCFLHHQFSNWIDIRYPSWVAARPSWLPGGHIQTNLALRAASIPAMLISRTHVST